RETGPKIAVRSASVAMTTGAPEMGYCVTPLLKRDGPSSEATISPKRSAKRVRFEGELFSHRTALIVATTSCLVLLTFTTTPIRADHSSTLSLSGFTID